MNPWEQRKHDRWERRQERWAQKRACINPMGGMIWGLLLIGGGLLFLLRNLGIVYFENIGQYWPVIPIAIGLGKLISARSGHQVAGALWFLIPGAIFLLRNLRMLPYNVWDFVWPAAIIAIGLSLLLKHLYGPDWWGGGRPEPMPASSGPESPAGSGANWLHAESVFGGVERVITSQEFEGGKVAVVFGGGDIDLRGAATKRTQIVLHADAVFGGIELKVPDSWRVEVRGTGVFGSYEDLTHKPAAADAPTLIVKGGAVFGGVTVRN
jgi:predicted membrane protein